MLTLTAETAARIIGGQLLSGPANAQIKGLTIDSREIQPGFMFVAFEGQHVDGHDYISQAVQNGATAVLVGKDNAPETPANIATIKSDDALAAIQKLAVYERDHCTGPVVAVTGSNGKTTTKEMLKSVFATLGPCLATKQNQNNELGLPLTLLRHDASHTSIVVEMGMRARGEIEELSTIAKPTTGIITNIGHSHLELLGSQEQIALAKTELLESLPEDGYAVLLSDDPWLRKLAHKTSAQIVWFGMSEDCDAWAENVSIAGNSTMFTAHVLGSSAKVTLPTLGQHNVLNALSALLAGAVNGLQLQKMAEALQQVSSVSGRLHQVPGKDDRIIIDDCYNASPSSMSASLHVLQQVAGQKNMPAAAILGDMYELGTFAEEGHRQTGALAAQMGIQHVITVGQMSRWIAEGVRKMGKTAVHEFSDTKALLEELDRILPPHSAVLVKASRGMHLEEIVRALT
ncbi:UDP-N-acetylmuramoyl-tripeptide--D-alanyl-D-alanine ligase [Alicyclobacillus sp. SO9]|uniref:UDP-N-acetylmuramoyl-tripeptide--D-alanyl-D- alanine ligase n=1 Tax=Alicyclobacillus sp. SO9 TaxID=2665646 RepID=UPI0018E8FEB1|nr:UDP-N-acetylmuramoyl-tripeptide--D-alanyl-D-alanine ligase [Alicyclobacillus sp. SO9]QQE78161.1 UDP-N-acetylmuramoyl-tripeptide--D-alanyl-D-alanine ligase [Alicyclobacillus sp. SO9]